MRKLEFLDLCELVPWVWWRFLYNVFLIWLHSLGELREFLERLNRKVSRLRGKLRLDKMLCLDVMVTLTDGGFSADVYQTTDTHQYLTFTSCNPSHVKRGIPYALILRPKRICSSESF